MKKLLLILLVALLALTGCSSSTNEDPDAPVEKVFTYALGGEPTYLDPAIAGDAVTNKVVSQMYEGLFGVNESGELVNELAESYTVSEDGLVYTFKLIDANWSDGQPITAHDFVYGIKRAVGYGPTDAYYSSFITKNVEGGKEASALLSESVNVAIADLPEMGVVAIDDKTLEITIQKDTPYFVSLLTQGTFFPMREDYAVEAESAWANEVGTPVTGAFMVESISDKEEIVLVPNPNYRLADEVTLDKIVFKIMPDADAQLNAFKAGEIDFAELVPSSAIHTYDGTDEFFTIDPYVINYFVTINTGDKAPEALKDVNVRKALNYAVDRESLLAVLDAGSTQYALHGIVPKGIPGATGDFRTEADDVALLSEYNKEEAIRLLTEAGYTTENPLEISYYYNDSTMHRDVAQVLQAQFKEVGVDLELKTGEIRVFFDDRTNSDYELARHANSADYLDPMIYLEMYLRSSQGTTPAVNDPVYDQMVADANLEKDPVKRMEMLHAAEEYFVAEQAYIIPLFGYTNPMLISTNVSNLGSSPDGALDMRFVEIAE